MPARSRLWRAGCPNPEAVPPRFLGVARRGRRVASRAWDLRALRGALPDRADRRLEHCDRARAGCLGPRRPPDRTFRRAALGPSRPHAADPRRAPSSVWVLLLLVPLWGLCFSMMRPAMRLSLGALLNGLAVFLLLPFTGIAIVVVSIVLLTAGEILLAPVSSALAARSRRSAYAARTGASWTAVTAPRRCPLSRSGSSSSGAATSSGCWAPRRSSHWRRRCASPHYPGREPTCNPL